MQPAGRGARLRPEGGGPPTRWAAGLGVSIELIHHVRGRGGGVGVGCGGRESATNK